MVPSMLRSHEPDDHYISVTFYWIFLLMEYINHDLLQIAMGGKMKNVCFCVMQTHQAVVYMVCCKNCFKMEFIELRPISRDFMSLSNTGLWEGNILFVFQTVQTCIALFSVLGALQGYLPVQPTSELHLNFFYLVLNVSNVHLRVFISHNHTLGFHRKCCEIVRQWLSKMYKL